MVLAGQVKGRVSVVIPGRCEDYFQQTIDSALERAAGDVEVVAVIDGYEPDPPLVARDERVKLIKLDKSIGQRAAYNLGVRESTGEYVMKIDAHALMSPGYDEALKAHCPPQTVVLPEMRRLDVHKWEYKPRGFVKFMFFGLDMYTHDFVDYRKRPEARVDYPEVMTGQGSCWFTTREWNDYIGLLDERVGSWGNVGIEVSLRTWLCGGSQIVNPRVWQAHWFRKDEGGFPYPMDGRQVARAHAFTRDNYYFHDDAFEHQTRPFSWIIEKFAPVPGWEAFLTDGYTAPRVIVYYTDSQLEPILANAVRKWLRDMVGPIPIISVSQEPLAFGTNVNVGPKPKVYRSMYEQLLAGLEAAPEGAIIYCVEHDVFYHPSHFAFIPPTDDKAYFNNNRYHYRLGCANFVHARGKLAMSQCVAYREVLIAHCKDRLAKWDQGIETKIDEIPHASWESEKPNIDIRHGDNLTPDGDYKRAYYKGQLPEGKTVTNLPGWGSPGHTMKKLGYHAPVVEAAPLAPEPVASGKAADYLHARYKHWLPQVSPVRIPRINRGALAQIFGKLGFRCGAEVGVRDGLFSEVLCKGVPNLRLLCVDIWSDSFIIEGAPTSASYARAQARLAPYNATLIRNTSVAASLEIPDASLDFVYIDACHEFDYVMEDVIAWGRKVKPGGIISGHDYIRTRNFGVVQAVDLYTQMHGVTEWFITDEKEASWFFAKPV